MTISDFIFDQRRFFWVLNIGGWGGYVAAAYLGSLVHEKPNVYLAVIVITASLGFFLTIPIRAAFHRLWDRPPTQLAIACLVICYVLALAWTSLENHAYWAWVKNGWQPDPGDWMYQFGGVMGSFYVLLCWSGLYFGIKYYQQLQQQTQATLRATAAAHQAQLKMLRYQLNPHFLFNTLNAISTLVLDRQNATANLAVTRLSDFLRYSLDNDPMKRVTLGKELDALDLYLEIEKVRFDERLIVKKELESSALVALVPSLILQPIIENAIKYAVTPEEDGGTLWITARTHGNSLMMTVADNGPGLGNGGNKVKKSCGVGLANTRERLKQLYGDDQALTLAPNSPRGLVVTINLPLDLGTQEPKA